ncbi:type II toxin-antitoxin system HipA family toxin YjjJ [Dechloromonas sp. CZR5]|uniref:type II toxin-antitoxin system HipA family toxin YjjJ n=1 Tax=Dechloromonas sp. CZR5 TaxID=2608630 RepID=UPI00123E1113|nr:type II toxin-antitoxin system HipA family toxin YjjJ [Dechloromonas sp. CZR5]
MSAHADSIRIQLGRGPQQVRQLVDSLGLSQPTISRAINALGDEIVRIGSGPSIQYALRDPGRGLGDVPVYRVSAEGTIRQLGTLIPVRPDGFVMLQGDGKTLHSDSLPWWLDDMRPQGYLGRNYAARQAAQLGLPSQLNEWNDSHALRALLVDGFDAVGNLLLGDRARDAFLSSPPGTPINLADKGEAYIQLAEHAARGEVPGSSAGGEQPKFVSYVQTPDGPQHVIVKFTLPENNPVTERWRDLLLAEHLALETLFAEGIAAVRTRIMDFGSQRFLEVERFDRVGELGRRGLFSMKALDAEFVGAGAAGWSVIAHALAKEECITPEAASGAALLQAIGVLIGNTDMHTGNISFVSEHGRPYHLAPAYDMLPMGFSPKSGGSIPTTLPEATLHADIPPETWVHAAQVAQRYLECLRGEQRFSAAFRPCIDALGVHLETALGKIARLG